MNPVKITSDWGVTKSKGHAELLTVSRGKCSSEAERVTKVFHDLVQGKVTNDTQAIRLLKKIRDVKWNYSGVFYSVYFRVNTRILLQELGFYGPFKEDKASYFVHIEIFKPKYASQLIPLCGETLPICKKKLEIVGANKDELFVVNLDEGVDIQANTWHLIQFKLDGPETSRSDSCSSHVKVDRVDGDEIHFEFNTNSSKQMPLMKFYVLEEST